MTLSELNSRNNISIKSKLLFLLIAILMLTGLQKVYAGKIIYKGNSEGMFFRVERMVEGHGVVWGMSFLNDNEIIFTERNGQIKILKISSEKVVSISGAPKVMSQGQGGLLDVKVPKNGHDGWIYFTYSKLLRNKTATTLARAKRVGNRLTDWQDMLVSKSAANTTYHFGSRIAFDQEKHIYFTIGDRGERRNAQNLANHAGTILRLNLDGTIPQDNPFVTNDKVLSEIWSYGHRNSQGITYDPFRKRIWAIEHGPRGGDEINHILPGKNYGWPVVSHGKEYNSDKSVGESTEKAGMETPVKVYIPSIAPGSLMLYTGNAFPKWKGDLLAGALKLTHINHIKLNEKGNVISEERLLNSLSERIRALIQSPNGWIYLSTDTGQIWRIIPE